MLLFLLGIFNPGNLTVVPSAPSPNTAKGRHARTDARSRVFPPPQQLLPAPSLIFTPNSFANIEFGDPAVDVPAVDAPISQGGGSIKNDNYKKWKSQKIM